MSGGAAARGTGPFSANLLILDCYTKLMCTLTDRILLCACDEDALTDPDWILERRDPSKAEQHRKGKAMAPRFSKTEVDWLEHMTTALQAGCFDFDYTPCSGDVLTLRRSDRWYRFRFTEQGWTVDRSNALTGWRAQMVRTAHGRLERP